MVNKYFDGVVTNTNIHEDIDDELINMATSLRDNVDLKMDNLRIADSLELIFELFRRCNKYIDETMPWVLAKDSSKIDRLNTVLYNLVESIRIGTVLLQAYLPDTSERIFDQINTQFRSYGTLDKFGYYESGSKVGEASVLFKRIDC